MGDLNTTDSVDSSRISEVKFAIGAGDEISIGHSEAAKNSNVSQPGKDTTKAWIVCLSGFLLQIIILGILHIFGIFFVAFLAEFKTTKAEAAWVGSIAYGLLMLFGPVSSAMINRYGNHVCSMCGVLICATSMFTSSFVKDMSDMFGTFSVIYGIGASLAITPTMTIAGDYFDRYLTVATGLMVAGSSTGTLVLSPISSVLIRHLGWRNTFRVLAGVILLNLISAYMFKTPNMLARTTSQRIRHSLGRRIMSDLQLWKNRVFVVWVIAITCCMFGYYIPYVHLVSHCIELGISESKASIIMMTLGGATASGRIMFGKIVSHGVLNRLHMHQISMVVTGAGTMCLPLITSFHGIMTYVILIGLVDGCYVVLLPVLNATLAGQENKVLAWGYLSGVASFTYTLGPPVAGWIYDATGSYNIGFHLAGVPVIIGCLILFLIPWAQRTGTTTNIMAVAKSYADLNSSQSYAIMENAESIDVVQTVTPLSEKHETSSPEQSQDDMLNVAPTKRICSPIVENELISLEDKSTPFGTRKRYTSEAERSVSMAGSPSKSSLDSYIIINLASNQVFHGAATQEGDSLQAGHLLSENIAQAIDILQQKSQTLVDPSAASSKGSSQSTSPSSSTSTVTEKGSAMDLEVLQMMNVLHADSSSGLLHSSNPASLIPLTCPPISRGSSLNVLGGSRQSAPGVALVSPPPNGASEGDPHQQYRLPPPPPPQHRAVRQARFRSMSECQPHCVTSAGRVFASESHNSIDLGDMFGFSDFVFISPPGTVRSNTSQPSAHFSSASMTSGENDLTSTAQTPCYTHPSITSPPSAKMGGNIS